MNIVENKYIIPITACVMFTLNCLVFVVDAVAKYRGHAYLPSADWLAASVPYAFAVGVLCMLLLWTVLIDMNASAKGPRQILKVFSGYLVAFAVGAITVTNGPALIALIIGSKTELSYTVAYVDSPTHRRRRYFSNSCAKTITLTKEMLGAATFCASAEAPEAKLLPGTHVVVTGTGTRYGVFMDSVKVVGEGG